MIPVQKHFPPELLRRWRKVMREDVITQRRQFDADWILEQVNDPEKAERLTQLGWDVPALRKTAEEAKAQEQSPFDRWKLSQERQQWIYTMIAGMVLALVAFVVSGGCR